MAPQGIEYSPNIYGYLIKLNKEMDEWKTKTKWFSQNYLPTVSCMNSTSKYGVTLALKDAL